MCTQTLVECFPSLLPPLSSLLSPPSLLSPQDVKLYEEVTSLEEFTSIVETSLEEYNNMHKNRMNLVIFRYNTSVDALPLIPSLPPSISLPPPPTCPPFIVHVLTSPPSHNAHPYLFTTLPQCTPPQILPGTLVSYLSYHQTTWRQRSSGRGGREWPTVSHSPCNIHG